jgi:hypothetical protein
MLLDFLSGAIAMGFALAGLFFLTFWRRTREGLFLAFCLAFWLLGFAQGLLVFADIPVEERSWLFLVRLAAFFLILVAIWHKNRGTSKRF